MQKRTASPQRLVNLRKDYARAALGIPDVTASPLRQCDKWLSEAQSAEVAERSVTRLIGIPSAAIKAAKGPRVELLWLFSTAT